MAIGNTSGENRGTHRLFSYWGKAWHDGLLPTFHPLVFHSLDVAAVTVAYLQRHDALRRQYARWLGTTEREAVALVAFLAALHDLGKFADNFQWKRDDLVVAHGVTKKSLGADRHDVVSRSFWRWAEPQLQAVLGRYIPGLTKEQWRVLTVASFGHHGKPPACAADFAGTMFEASRADAIQFVTRCAELLLPEQIVVQSSDEAIATCSWSLSGLIVLSDWLGSNTDWFAYRAAEAFGPPDERMARYWTDVAQENAETALAQSGVCADPALPYAGAKSLFGSLEGRSLRPAQQLVETIEIEAGPQMFVLEDATGSGKTEAALALSARLMNAGVVDGFYFALPTQATADQMFERIALSMGRMFAQPGRVACVLSHAARDQNPWYRAIRRKFDGADLIDGEEDTASFGVSAWLGQSNKRALIAQLGAGTVDQCMLAVLRAKHQSLRLLGLQRKVLIIDEVHSYDAYITGVLGELMRAQAALGGSVILLSATLSSATRCKLINSFLKGLEPAGLKYAESAEMPYPYLTRTALVGGRFSATPHPIAATEASKRHVAVDYVDSQDVVIDRINGWLADGKAVVWIRNTVGDAVDAYRRVRPDLCEKCTLFHSRFALADRQRIQESVLRDFGKKSDASSRRGRLVIATQVLSQSLDLDADEMVVDLAPIDELLQRQGRLRRHVRDSDGRVTNSEFVSEDARGPIRLTVFGPTLTAQPEEHWYRKFSKGAAWVYKNHGRVWLTARCLGSGLNLPQDFRRLVDAVYETDAAIPEALVKASFNAEGEAAGEKQLGQMGCISFADGFADSGDWRDEERVATRLGQTVEAVLARSSGAGELVPWANGDADQPCALSAIRIPNWWLRNAGENALEQLLPADESLAAQVETIRSRIATLKYRAIVVLTPDNNGGWVGRTKGGVSFTYDEEVGLGYERGNA